MIELPYNASIKDVFIHNLFVARVGGVMIVSAIAARKNTVV